VKDPILPSLPSARIRALCTYQGIHAYIPIATKGELGLWPRLRIGCCLTNKACLFVVHKKVRPLGLESGRGLSSSRGIQKMVALRRSPLMGDESGSLGGVILCCAQTNYRGYARSGSHDPCQTSRGLAGHRLRRIYAMTLRLLVATIKCMYLYWIDNPECNSESFQLELRYLLSCTRSRSTQHNALSHDRPKKNHQYQSWLTKKKNQHEHLQMRSIYRPLM
jgi:hypothetical protein